MSFVFLFIIAVMAALFAFFGLSLVWHGIRTARTRRGLPRMLAGVLLLYGTAGFLGAAFSSMGGLDWMGSFEWPIGDTDGVARAPNGNYVVPHTPSGRVQIYDPQLRFLHGWRIDAGGGTFTLRAEADGTIDIHTARGNRHLVYDQAGHLLRQSTYDFQAKPSPLDTPSDALHLNVPTPWWLWPITGPFYAWICAILSMLLIARMDRHTPPSASQRRMDQRLEHWKHSVPGKAIRTAGSWFAAMVWMGVGFVWFASMTALLIKTVLKGPLLSLLIVVPFWLIGVVLGWIAWVIFRETIKTIWIHLAGLPRRGRRGRIE